MSNRQGSTRYVVVPAPGHYGDKTKVVSGHRTLEAAFRARKPGYVVREAWGHRKGDEWLRVFEELYPVIRDEREQGA